MGRLRELAAFRGALSLSLCFGLLASAGHALEVPPHTGLVVDQAQLLSVRQQRQIEQSLRRFQEQVGPQIQLLTVQTLQGEPIESYSIKVVDRWKLGDQKRDDGVLLLVAVEDRAVRIEVGQGLEGQIPDAIAGRIIQDQIIPYFKEGRYPDGILNGLQKIAERLGGQLSGFPSYGPPARSSRHSQPLGPGFIFFLFVIFFILIPVLRFLGFIRNPRGALLRRRHASTYWGGGGFGGFLGGGGFGGGGGGGFSGGGASGRW